MVIGHLNINLLPNKFDQLKKMVIEDNMNTLTITETKTDSRFHNSQFVIEGLLVLSDLIEIGLEAGL